MLEARGQPYVLATRSSHTLRLLKGGDLVQTDPLTLASALPQTAWSTHPAGQGSKGIRLYDWARLALPWTAADGFERWLLFRRNRRDPEDQAYYLAFTRAGKPLAELAGAAGLRWTIEECFQCAKEELGLDHCEARSWHGWHRQVAKMGVNIRFEALPPLIMMFGVAPGSLMRGDIGLRHLPECYGFGCYSLRSRFSRNDLFVAIGKWVSSRAYRRM